MTSTPILIVGAGPTGLVLALSLARRGIRFRLIDEAGGPGEHSRAMAVHARTLEFYRQFGFAEEVVAAGVEIEAIQLREAGRHGASREVATVSFKDLGDGISPYPFALAYPQDDHERLLVGKLKAHGVEVEWNARLAGFTQETDGVRATIARHGGGTEIVEADFICGCDGAHSQVRKTMALGFPGGTYNQLFYVADVMMAGEFNRDLRATLGRNSLALMLPVRSTGMQRLIGLIPPDLSDREDLGFEDIRDDVEALLGVKVEAVNWFSRYRVHHRVADRFRSGRAFLLGDSAHIHSPAGGQGMNTGIGDAVNLGWKLASFLQGRAGKSILDTYQPERIGFARALVATTDRAFTPLVAEGIEGELMRRVVAPLVLTVATRFALTRHALFRTVSQARVHYADSTLSEGKAGSVQGGDRLPWTGARGPDNFAPLRCLEWQMHVFGAPGDGLAEACRARALPLHVFDWSAAATDAGFRRDAAYLVRPDGYVALAADEEPATRLAAYVDRFGLRFGPD